MIDLEELEKLRAEVKPGEISAEPHGKHTALYAGRSRKQPSSHGYRLCNIDDEDPGVIPLIVAAVNALPELLARLERYDDALNEIAAHYNGGITGPGRLQADSMRDIALAALNEVASAQDWKKEGGG